MVGGMKNATHERRKAEGLCPRCGVNRPEPGRSWCNDCVVLYKKKYYRDRSEEGLCRACGKNKPPDGRKVCLDCVAQGKARKMQHLSHGLCCMCGKNPVVTGKKMCAGCLYEKNKIRREAFLKNGLCLYCSSEKAIKGLKVCLSCQKKRKEQRSNRIEGGICVRCGSRSSMQGKTICIECSEMTKRTRDEIKRTVIEAYGGKCACCGEAEIMFLSIDHVNGSGNRHRKEIGGGHVIYNWLVKHGFPKDNYQILCHNCNLGRYINGGECPHKTKVGPCSDVAASASSKTSSAQVEMP